MSIINAPWFFVNTKITENDYSSWMNENLSNDILVKDIVMLGAHDAFSNDISVFSDVDNKSADGLMQGFIGRLIKGFSIRQSKTQVVSAADLLKSGVRYFDLRLSYNEEENVYYTVHNYFSTPLAEVLTELNSFLVENEGEFIIIDIQHVYGVDYDSLSDFEEVYDYFFESNILDFAYASDLKQLKDLTFGDVTNNKSDSGVVILSKFAYNNKLFWNYSESIRSNWANEDDFDLLIDFLEVEKDTVTSDEELQEKFRVMQAVTTMQLSVPGILRSFASWSLLGRANSFNEVLLQYENLDQLVESMPIIMVDYSSKPQFVDEIMEKIIELNSN
jgi:hypothetical protein